MYYRFNVKLAAANKDGVNHFNVSLQQSNKRVLVCVTPAIHSDDGRILMLPMQAERVSNYEDMPRLNRKRLEALAEQAKGEFSNKTGPVYDAALRLCQSQVVTLDEPITIS
jgi:hypothetical protein